MSELAPGSIFAGHRIEEQIGRGGMGVVFRATHLRLNRVVALKVVAPELAADEGFRERFEREAEHAAAIDHPNVVDVYDAGEQDGVLFATMRYVEGTDLGELIDSRGALEPALAIAIVSQAAAGLEAAHRGDLIHRDVKPANILVRSVDDDMHAYVTDFGLAKARSSAQRFTATGILVGTVDYIAPEAIHGEEVDARTDIYSLGGVLFHALTGAVPYPRDNEAAKIFAHGAEPPPLPSEHRPGLSPQLDALVTTAMATDPGDRYASAGEMGRAALETGGASPPPAEPPSPRPVAASPPAKTPPASAASEPPRAGVLDVRAKVPAWALAFRVLVGLVVIAGIVVLMISVLGGDDNANARTPDETVRGFAASVAARDFDGACELLSEGLVTALGGDCPAQLEKGLTHQDVENAEAVDAEVIEEDEEMASVLLTGRASKPQEVGLVNEEGEWKIASLP